MSNNGLLPIGKVVGVHGLKGNLKVVVYAGTPTAFVVDKLIFLRNLSGQNNSYVVEWVGPHKNGLRLSLKEITDRGQAEELIGAEIFIKKSDLPELEDDVYYWFELIGLAVRTTEGQLIGRLDAIIETGSNDVYVVKGKDGETLIPAVESVVLEIDLEKRTMRVALPDGL